MERVKYVVGAREKERKNREALNDDVGTFVALFVSV